QLALALAEAMQFRDAEAGQRTGKDRTTRGALVVGEAAGGDRAAVKGEHGAAGPPGAVVAEDTVAADAGQVGGDGAATVIHGLVVGERRTRDGRRGIGVDGATEAKGRVPGER